MRKVPKVIEKEVSTRLQKVPIRFQEVLTSDKVSKEFEWLGRLVKYTCVNVFE